MTLKTNQFLGWVIAVGLFLSVLISGIIGVTTSMLMQSYSLGLMGVVCLFAGVLSSQMYRQVGRVHLIIINLAILYFALRAYFSPSIDLGIGDMFLLFSAASVYAVVNLIKDPKLVKLSVAAILFLFAANVLHYFPAFAAFRDDLLPFAKGNEVSGMFNHRNFCSNLVMMGTLLLIAYAVMPRDRTVKISLITYLTKGLAALAGISGVYSLLFMGARGALIGLAAGLFILCLCWLISKKGNALKIILGAVVVITIPMILFFGKVEFLIRKGMLDDRMQYFTMAVDQIPDSILVGSGSMSYSYKCYENWGDFGTHHNDHVWVHNEFLQTLTDYGIIGLLLLIVVLLWIFYLAARNLLQMGADSDSPDIKHVIALSVIVGFLMDCLVSFPAHSYVNLMVVAMLAAWIIPKNKKEQIPSKSSIYIKRLSFFVMGIAMIYLSVPRIKAANVYADYAIYTDTMNWNPYEGENGNWLSALEAVNKVSPNYISYSRLADLYAIQAETGIDKELNAKKSLECSEQALKRHPFYAPALLTKAKSLWYLGEFKLADENFEYLAEFTKHRRRFYRASVARVSCLLDAGQYYLANEDFIQSKHYFHKALKVLSQDDPKDKYAFSRVFYDSMQAGIMAGYSEALLASGEHAELDQLMEEMYGSKGRYLSFNNEILFLIQGRMFALYGQSLYMRRKPSLAYKYFIWAEKNFSIVQQRWETEFSRGDLDIIEEMKRVVEILKGGKIEPAK